MFPISKILMPVDFSDRSRAMLPYANTVASRYRYALAKLREQLAEEPIV